MKNSLILGQLNLNIFYLKHFYFKTVEEYFKNKMNRGYPDVYGIYKLKKFYKTAFF